MPKKVAQLVIICETCAQKCSRSPLECTPSRWCAYLSRRRARPVSAASPGQWAVV